jgi:phosphatidylglycerophosphate synthase
VENKFPHERSLKTDPKNDFLNLQKYLFITSATLTRFFYNTGVNPHHVILISMIFGIAASLLIIQSDKLLVIAGAILLFYKNVLDKVDGSLARAKGLDSRRGRFYDSISDFVVTLTTFTAITYKLYLMYQNPLTIAAGFTAMVFSMMQCSYFIFYQVFFIKQSGKTTVNRLIENVTDEDIKTQDKWTTFLQRVFLIIYGWQDRVFL